MKKDIINKMIDDILTDMCRLSACQIRKIFGCVL